MDSPRISVLLPVYNDEKYVGAAVESILRQSFRDFELVIVNDGSTDDTPAILESLAEADDRIRLYHQENRGVSGTRNRLIELARGQFIANMDGDDISAADRLEVQIDYLRRHPEVDLVGTQMEYIDPQGQPTGKPVTTTPTDPATITWQLLFGMCVFHATWCARRETMLTEAYDPDFRYAEDYDLISRLSRCHTIANVDQPLYKVRESPSRISNEKAEEQAATARAVMHREHRVLLGDDYDRALSQALIQGSDIGLAAVRYGTQLAIRLAERQGFSATERTIVLRRLYDRIACATTTTVLHKAAARLLRGGHTSFRALRAALPG
jgi:glycosyltransferase involved in cell wall biosynthesis